MGRANEIFQKMHSPEDRKDWDMSGTNALFSEWKQDQAMARNRQESGREPACQTAEIHPPQGKSGKTLARSRIRERDIPF